METPTARTLLGTAVLFAVAGSSVPAGDFPDPLCRLVIHEERAELESAELDLDLARSSVAAFEKIFKLIEDLWRNEAIERMVYLQAKYDRDAARLALERATHVLERQEALIDQYRLACVKPADDETAGKLEDAHKRYREAHCAVLTKDVEIAEVNLTFDKELLASVKDLREGRVATLPDVIRAELDVEREEKRLATGKKRAAACRRDLAGL